jgi:BASS family bile acid:Na+ symporter
VPFIVINSINIFDITYVEKEITMTAIALKMFFVVTVPVIIGMTIRHLSGHLLIRYMK